jgi:hypothetical protein
MPYPSSIELMNFNASQPGMDEPMGPDYSGSIPPPPGGGAVTMAPMAYEPMMAVPANQLGMPMSVGSAAKAGCGLLCLAILGIIGGHFGRKKGKGGKKGFAKHLVAGGAGVAGGKAMPVIATNSKIKSFGPKALVAFGSGYVAGRWGGK